MAEESHAPDDASGGDAVGPTANPPARSPGGEGVWRDTAGWLASLVVHAAAVVLMALAVQPARPVRLDSQLVASSAEDLELGESIAIDTGVALDTPLDESLAADDSDIARELDALASAAVAPSAALALEPLALPSDAGLVAPVATAGGGVESLRGVAGRGKGARGDLVASKGGSPASEVAVARGLRWIADHQNTDGTWSLRHDLRSCRGRCPNGAVLSDNEAPEKAFADSLRSGTALALLPFLGAGETHVEGRYKRVVGSGLRALVAMGKPDPEGAGASWADSGALYAHGLASIVLAEAYGMTRDPALRGPAQAAIEHVAFAQDPAGGGWRYEPQATGDTSVTGWQIMALKSAALAELEVRPRVVQRATKFLDSTAADGGAAYRYLAPTPDELAANELRDPTPTLSAVGLLCRMYLGWRRGDERLQGGVQSLADSGPSADNFYHNYYAAQALFHYTGGEGPLWRSWNERVRDQLVEQQETRGHARGSWWVAGPHNKRGGRLYATALATMTLEVYYRYLPLYQEQALEADFPD
jgi:hypothetical protein